MRVWKICRQPFAADALQGIGGLTTSGRWHHRGIPIVYTAASPALAALEVLVPVDPLSAPADLRLLAIALPPDLSMEVIDPGALPQGWGDLPAPPALQALGTAWLRSHRTAALRVPSAVIRVEHNILLNPRHSEAAGCRLISDEPFSFDPRLLGQP